MGLRKGDLKFTLAGEKLQGSWVLVRMRPDRERDRSNRNNWLLIKHRDGYEREGGEPVTEQDRSVASGRTMEEIAAGKGRRPKPFMLAGKAAASDAVWHSNRDGKAGQAIFPEDCRTVQARTCTTETSRHRRCRSSSRLSSAGESAGRLSVPIGSMKSSSTAIACSCVLPAARPSCAPAKGLDWTSDFVCHRGSRAQSG